ncbi:hypothetical protein TNCV_1837801 [Trichonephila clavipes]|nr:hypothetical protein TNCV_1837801 [Trichonephila clavipes]
MGIHTMWKLSSLRLLRQNISALEVRNSRKCSNMAVRESVIFVDGIWERRGHSFMNGCVAALCIDTGKLLELEIMPKFCKICNRVKVQLDMHVLAIILDLL